MKVNVKIICKRNALFKVAPLLLLTFFVYLLIPTNPATSKDNQIVVPNDFQVTLTSGGLGANRSERDSVTISANGKCRFWSGSNIAGDNSIKRDTKFKISKTAVSRIFTAFETHRFSDLDAEYRDPDIHDGDMAEISVRMHKATKTVRTINESVDNFDDVAKVINSEIPEKYRIFYNAIYEF